MQEERHDDFKSLNPIKTSEYLSKYERARILGIRALQISNGNQPLIDSGRETDPLSIAEKELAAGKNPFIIRRNLPDGTYEDVAVCNLYGGGKVSNTD